MTATTATAATFSCSRFPGLRWRVISNAAMERPARPRRVWAEEITALPNPTRLELRVSELTSAVPAAVEYRCSDPKTGLRLRDATTAEIAAFEAQPARCEAFQADLVVAGMLVGKYYLNERPDPSGPLQW